MYFSPGVTRAAISLCALFSSSTALGLVTYNGSEGVYQQIFAPVCTNCHNSVYPDLDANRQGAPGDVNFNTYTLAMSLPTLYAADPVTYPPASWSNNVRAIERAATAPQPASASMPPTYLYSDYPTNTIPYTLLSQNNQTLLTTWQSDGFPEQAAPTVSTNAATLITKTTARLNASIAQNGATTTARFRYNTSLPLNTGTLTTATNIGSGGGATDYTFTTDISSLNCGTTYYFHAQAVNAINTTVGNNLSFTTSACSAPVITQGTSTTVAMSVDGTPDAFSLTLNATDSDNSTLTWSISSAATHGIASTSGTGNSRTISYTPNAGYFGTDSFIVTVTDDTPGTPLTDTITVNVNIGLDPPIISEGTSVPVNISEDNSPTAFGLTLNATDADTNLANLAWTVSSQAAHGTASATGSGASRVVSYTPDANYSGSDSFVVTVSDPQNNTDSITVNVTIAAVNNDPPVISSTAGTSAYETMQYQYQIAASDPDNVAESFTYLLTNAPSGMSVSVTGLITWTPQIGNTTSGTVIATVTDSQGTTDTETFTISVSPPDADADAIPDYTDNCVNDSNNNQLDTDTDGAGDVCDSDPDGNGLLDGNLTFSVTHDGLNGNIIFQNNSTVVITATLSNGTGNEAFDWTHTDSRILGALIAPLDNGNSLSFEALNLPLGVYLIDVTVTDNSSTTHNTLLINVLAATEPVLTAADTDGDGTPNNDVTEGYQDDDNDGIPNFRDDTTDLVWLPNQTGDSDTTRFLQTESGTELALGPVATAAGHFGAIITADDIANYGGPAGTASNNATDSNYTAISDIFDFEIRNVQPAGASITVVLPLSSNLRNHVIYRKFHPTLGWHDFVTDSRNHISSASSTLGICPSPGSNEYSTGLNVFDDCVQLIIEDGGPNDTDGEVNGIVRDPGVITVSSTPTSANGDCGDNGFNNCTEQRGGIGLMNFAWLLILTGAFMVCQRLRRI
jgi:hypothetical protein